MLLNLHGAGCNVLYIYVQVLSIETIKAVHRCSYNSGNVKKVRKRLHAELTDLCFKALSMVCHTLGTGGDLGNSSRLFLCSGGYFFR